MENMMHDIQEIKEYIGALQEVINEVISEVADGGRPYEKVECIATAIGELINGLVRTQAVHAVAIETDTIKEALEEATNAIENDDLDVLVDVFRYEIVGLLQEWESLLPQQIN